MEEHLVVSSTDLSFDLVLWRLPYTALSQASFSTKGLRPQLSSGDTNGRLLHILEGCVQVVVCVGLVDAVKTKAMQNKLKRLDRR